MSIANLSLVSSGIATERSAAETVQLRFEDVTARAKVLAQDQVSTVRLLLDQLRDVARSASRSGDELPAGVKELCRQVAEEAAYRAKSLDAIVERTTP